MIFEILFWQSNRGRISRFYIPYLILTFKLGVGGGVGGRILHFDNRNSFMTFELGPNIAIDIWNPIWLSNSGPISHFDVWYPILSFESKPNIAFCHSKSYFDIQTGAEYSYNLKAIWWTWIDHNLVLFLKNEPFTKCRNIPTICKLKINSHFCFFSVWKTDESKKKM